jgi:prevent-host-death family protein
MPKAPQSPHDVGVRELRNHLSRYLAQVADGREIIVTDRGKVVARVVPVDRLSKMDQLIAEGVITPPSRPRTPASELPRIEVEGDFKEFIRWTQGKG